jgi:hypothetical protein
MSDEKTPKIVDKVYTDLLQPSTKVVGETLKRTISLTLLPLRSLLWSFEKIEQSVENWISNKWINKPIEDLKSPEPEIAVPILQALLYTGHNETLREMFLNLLSNSMDRSMETLVHPSFVEIIKQMNKLDAKTFVYLIKQNSYIPAIHPKIKILNSTNYFYNATPEWFLGLVIDNCSVFELSASLISLNRLGLISLMYDRQIIPYDYNKLCNNKILLEIFQKIQLEHPDIIIELQFTSCAIFINEFGNNFAKCVYL